MSIALASFVRRATGSPLGFVGAAFDIKSAAEPAFDASSWVSALAPSLLQGQQSTQPSAEPQPEMRRERPPHWTA